MVPDKRTGLCFSVPEGVEQPPSLQNIFKEIYNDLGTPVPASGNLERWSDQGVLLLNATLTVRAHQAGSHQNKGWETFTDAVILLAGRPEKNLVFLLWALTPSCKRRFYRHAQTFSAEMRASLPSVGQPRRLVRESPVQTNQSIFKRTRTTRNSMEN